MVITSLGIFGFLSKAHLEHSIATGGTNELQITNLERQIEVEQRSINDAESVLAQLDQTVQILLDADRVRGRSGALATRKSQTEEREALTQSINSSYDRIQSLQESLAPFKQEQLAIEVEVGPLKYIAELIYGQESAEDYFDEAVRAVIILLIITFDPLAVVLLLAATQGFTQRKQGKILAFNPDNVVDIEDNLVDINMDEYRVVEDAIPEDDDIDEYEVVREDPIDDPTDPVRKEQWDRGEWNQKI